ncbi:MAG: hypothetical protein JNJ83_21230 [Verrucomicrobiaceae bacterium]|nr:hypothetical protein [Verrucomicrobiaceae bacterium]
MKMKLRMTLMVVLLSTAATIALPPDTWKVGKFWWVDAGPYIDVTAHADDNDPHVALKDPTIVYHEKRWHLFGTLRKKSGTVCMQYLNFKTWKEANTAQRHEISFTDKYHCAPQVFYFTPHQKWYLIYQLAKPGNKPGMSPYCSTTTTLSDPKSWSEPQLMVTNPAPDQKWIDFWVICDEQKAHLFYTSNNGLMWRRETTLENFPHGWSDQVLALKDDIFEASHTYKLKNRSEYLTIIEAQAPGRRYYKAYLADRLEGPWRGLADNLENPFAALENVKQGMKWTTSISHGELLRAGVDERMEVESSHLKFLYQGVDEQGYRGNKYGGIPWKIGLLEQIP